MLIMLVMLILPLLIRPFWMFWKDANIVVGLYLISVMIILHELYDFGYHQYILCDFCHLKRKRKQITRYQKFYNYIKSDHIGLRNVLYDIFGVDVGSIILQYLPDYGHSISQ